MPPRCSPRLPALLTLLAPVAALALLDAGAAQAKKPAPLATVPELPPRLALSQVGYLPSWQKHALLISPSSSAAPRFAHVLRHPSGEVAARAPIGPARRDAATGDWLRVVDFSALRTPGRYALVVDAGSGRGAVAALRSASFEISADFSSGFEGLERLLLRSFYLQRCGVALRDEATGATHDACHLQDAQLPPAATAPAASSVASPAAAPLTRAQRVPATGGWHDAGDYGKYVATTAVAIGRVLSAVERDPARYRFDDLGIPESGNGVPDVLDEMKVGLDWMLGMQRGDGAVYRKVGGKAWPHKLVPERDEQARFAYGVTSPETAKAAAAWALAARLMRPYAPDDATRYLAAARRAWAWLEHQPAQVFDVREGDDSGSGPYRANQVDREASLSYDADDRLWAVAELAITTGEPAFVAQASRLAARAPINLYEWKDASSMALSYFLWQPALSANRTLSIAISARFAARAVAPLAAVGKSGYRLANQRFVWGSNKMAAEEAILMCTAYGLTGKPALLAAARDQLHYLLGRNHFSISFVSGVGERAVRDVTHIFAAAAGVRLPGLLVGGPNDAEQANIAPRGRGALSWIDDRRSYSSNEYAIDYNASLLGLLAALARDCRR